MSNEELCEQIQSGEDYFMEQLVIQNIGMVHKIARRYISAVRRYGGAEYDDLEQAAVLGLLEAVEKWEPARGTFMNIACFYMVNAIRSMLGILTSKRMIEHEAQPASFDTPTNDDENSSLYDLIADTSAESPEESACRADEIEAVRAAVNDLEEDARTLIRRVYFDGEIWPQEISKRRRLKAALRALSRNKRLINLLDDVFSLAYRHKGITAFNSSWSSAVEDAVLFMEKRRTAPQACRA